MTWSIEMEKVTLIEFPSSVSYERWVQIESYSINDCTWDILLFSGAENKINKARKRWGSGAKYNT